MMKEENVLPNLLVFAVDLPKLVANETQQLAPTDPLFRLYPTYLLNIDLTLNAKLNPQLFF
ncbi:MAG: hypothetical protein AAF485_04565 [Chloroflexota bacterium]